MKHITFYLDFVSPYAWLAFERLPEALAGLSYSVAYRPVLLGALLQQHANPGPAGIVPGGVDVVLECAGVPETFAQSIAVARRGGTVVVFGVMAKGEVVGVEPFDLLFRELRLEAAYLNPLTHGRAAALVASGVLALDPLISRTIPLIELPEFLAAPPPFGEVKTIVVPAQG